MKRAVSISIGSSKRDKTVELDLLGERVCIERRGTDGDMERAAQLYRELDGKVDAFGVGGADLGMLIADRWYPLYSVQKMVRFVHQTPIVDGTGIKNTLERRLAPFIEQHLAPFLGQRRVFVVSGADRWGMSKSFLDNGFDCIFGDIMFGLGLPLPVRGEANIKRMAALLMPIAGRLPFKWVYPTGSEQSVRRPRWEKYYRWGDIIAGDCHYIKHHMPDDMHGKIIATNTTTPADMELFRQLGVRHVVTSTPIFEGRSFGTNMIEAALIAVAGLGRKLTLAELDDLLDRLKFEPQLQELD